MTFPKSEMSVSMYCLGKPCEFGRETRGGSHFVTRIMDKVVLLPS